jgi:hypothetical protein
MTLDGPRTGQVDPPDNRSTWQSHVASWPPWREIDHCPSACPYASVCGRAGMCAQVHPRRLVSALARVCMLAGARPPRTLLPAPDRLASYEEWVNAEL